MSVRLLDSPSHSPHNSFRHPSPSIHIQAPLQSSSGSHQAHLHHSNSFLGSSPSALPLGASPPSAILSSLQSSNLNFTSSLIADDTSMVELIQIIGQKYPEGTLPEPHALAVARDNHILTVGQLKQLKAKHLVKMEFPVVYQREFFNIMRETRARKKDRRVLHRTQTTRGDSSSDVTDTGPDGSYIQRDLTLIIKEARNYPKNCSIFAVASIPNKLEYRTPSMYGDKFVVWTRSFVFPNVSLNDILTIRLFEVKKKKDKCLGAKTLKIRDMVLNTPTDESVFLSLVKKDDHISSKSSDIQLQFQYDLHETVMLNSEKYNELLKLIVDPKLDLIFLLEKEMKSEDMKVIKHIVHVFEHQECAYTLFKALIEHEIEKCDEPATLFRTDNFATEALDYYLKFVGSEYLKSTIGPHITKIIEQQLDCELEQLKLDRTTDLKQNFENFTKVAQLMTRAIFASHPDVPPQFRVLFHHLEITAAKYFPCRVEVGLTAINGFLFLRFFVPALMHPQQYGVWDGPTDPRTTSTLTLLARAIQKMANLTSFSRDREPHLHLINDLIKTSSKNLAEYVSRIIDEKEGEGKDLHYKPSIHVARDAAVLVEYFYNNMETFRQLQPDHPCLKRILELVSSLTQQTLSAKQMFSIKTSTASTTTSMDESDKSTLF